MVKCCNCDNYKLEVKCERIGIPSYYYCIIKNKIIRYRKLSRFCRYYKGE